MQYGAVCRHSVSPKSLCVCVCVFPYRRPSSRFVSILVRSLCSTH
ncbi:AGAP007842-PA, partial [Anopheles gambiae str. PEST]